MVSKCIHCDCGSMCNDHCTKFKCFKCDSDSVSDESCCEEAAHCLAAVPVSLLTCACKAWGILGCTSGCACYCPCSAFGLGCIAPNCPGCYCIKMTPEDRAFWAGKKPFEGGSGAGENPSSASGRRPKGKDAQTPGAVLVAGETSDGSVSQPSTKLSKAQEKAEAKRKKEEQDQAAAAQKKSEWGSMVAAQGGAGGAI
jgi:hypothetical protein